MSAQAGIFYFDRRPVDPEVLSVMGTSLDDYGPDRAGDYVQPGLAMVHRALHVTPEDALEQQPFISRRGNVMTWDGRLDNRGDLVAQLWRDLDQDTTDVAIALGAYEKWGVEGLRRLIGDWSLVVWDAERQTVVLASDYMGVRPLHYLVRPDSVSWSTTLECLVHIHDLYHQVEPHYLVGFLSYARHAGITPYKNVFSVETAQSITVSRDGSVAKNRFWNLGAPEIRHRTNEDYEAHLRSLFLDAVKNRLRSRAPVWSELSGGLDSSAVVCAADLIIKQGLAVAPDICTLSFITDGSPEADERRFVACVDEYCGRTTHLIQQDASFELVDSERHWVTPAQPVYGTLQSYRLVRGSGGRVLLTGHGGDAVMGNFIDYYNDITALLRRGRLFAAVGLARARALAGKQTVWDRLYKATQNLSQRRAVRRKLADLFMGSGGVPPATDQHIAEAFLLKPEFAAFWKDAWTSLYTRAFQFPDVSQWDLALGVTLMGERRHAQSPSDEPLGFTSHPHLDRPLVEFMLGIPISVLAPPGQPRALMRRAFAPFMPPRIVARFSKGFALPFYLRNTRDVLLRWIENPDKLRIIQLDFLDLSRLLPYLEELRDSAKNPDFFLQLLKIEQWIESRDQYLSRMCLSRPARYASESAAERLAFASSTGSHTDRTPTALSSTQRSST
jgi:asparagine synthase (glutamine-hydrolysing)